jgi:arylsulfatase
MACIAKASSDFPDSSARVPPQNAFISEVLVEKGWNNYAVEKGL